MATLQIELPDDLMAALSQNVPAPDRVALEALLVRLYMLGEVGSDRLADLLNLSHRETLELITQYGGSTVDAESKMEEAAENTTASPPYYPAQAGGIWAGITITDEEIAEVRRELQQSFDEDML
jgi:hypothetical protein